MHLQLKSNENCVFAETISVIIRDYYEININEILMQGTNPTRIITSPGLGVTKALFVSFNIFNNVHICQVSPQLTCTHEWHPIPHPCKWAMGCLSWIIWRKMAVIYCEGQYRQAISRHYIINYAAWVLIFHKGWFQWPSSSQYWEIIEEI